MPFEALLAKCFALVTGCFQKAAHHERGSINMTVTAIGPYPLRTTYAICSGHAFSICCCPSSGKLMILSQPANWQQSMFWGP